ncbi:MAG TPA: hypothetical protein VIV40_36405 [Kofleriaceae bacterium]
MRTILVISLLGLAVGCKDKPTTKAPPANVGSGSAGSGSSTASSPAPELILPKSDGTPPKKTTKPHVKADYERLSKLEYPGFDAQVRTVGEKVFEVRQKTKDHPRLWAVVTIKNCFECLPMELDKWKAKEQEIKALNLESLKDSKDIEWELGETTLNGQKIIYSYQVGTGNAPGEGGGQYAFTDAYVANYNDGINEIRVVASYKDDPVGKQDLKKLAPKEDLQKLALSFLDVYTHEW